jgi:hypothetical protein
MPGKTEKNDFDFWGVPLYRLVEVFRRFWGYCVRIVDTFCVHSILLICADGYGRMGDADGSVSVVQYLELVLKEYYY